MCYTIGHVRAVLHQGSAATVCVHHLRGAVDGEDLLHQFLGQDTCLAGVDVGADEVAGVDVDQHVGVVVDALARAGEFGDVPGVDLPGSGGPSLSGCGETPRSPG